MMGNWAWSKRTAAAIGLLASAFMAFPSVAVADHPFLPKFFPRPVERPPECPPLPVPLLPEDALTGYCIPDKYFKDVCGLAVDSDGHFYISDHDHDKIYRYPGFGWISDEDPIGRPCGLALSPYGLFVNDYRRGVWLYSNGPAKNIDPGPATGVAWDPPNKRVYVTHSSYVAAYKPDGTPIFDEGSEPLRIGAGNLGDAYGAAVSDSPATKGLLYVADASDERVKVFDPAISTVNPVKTIDGSLGPQQGFRDLIEATLAIDPTNGNLLVSDRLAKAEEPPMVVDEISPDGHFRGQLPHAIADGEPAGIAVDPVTHNVFVTTGRNAEAGVYAFGPAGPTYQVLLRKAGAGEGTVKSTPAFYISCPASCTAGEAEFDYGATVTLKASPAVHSTFSGWTVSGQPSACQGSGPCQFVMNAAAEVSAEFSPIPQENLTVTSEGEGTVSSEPAGIECGAFCSEHFDQGSTVVLNPSPAPHFHLAGWTVGGDPSACPGTDPCELTMDQAKAVTATFPPNPDRTLSLSISGPGGVISSPGGIDCQASCSHAFSDGTTVSLEAHPAPRYELLSWSGVCSGKRLCVVQLSEDQAVEATFVRIEDALAVSVIGAGTGVVSDPAAGIDCGLTCAGVFLRGSVLTLTAQAEKGSRFIDFSGCDSVAGQVCTVTVAEAQTVTALFGEAPEIAVRRVSAHGPRATLTVSVPAPGLLKASGKGIVKTALRARSEGVMNLHLSLSRKGRVMLHNSRGKLSVRVELFFTSADGSTVKTKKIVTFIRGDEGEGSDHRHRRFLARLSTNF